MKIITGSLQYSPVYKSHSFAFGNQCEKLGLDVKYIFNKNYKWMIAKEQEKKCYFIDNSSNFLSLALDPINIEIRIKLRDLLSKYQPDIVYLHNINPFLNLYVANIVRKYGGRFIQHVHEPYVEDKSVYGGLHQYWLIFYEYLQNKLMRSTDIAIVSSLEAERLFKERYSDFSGELMNIPLMYEDFYGQVFNNDEKRKYITFIGPPSKAKGWGSFLQIAEFSRMNELIFKFLVISRYPIEEGAFNGCDNIELYYKPRISDFEIGNLLSRSLMTLTPYRTARQSSVALTSYMYGTPVLSTSIGGLDEMVIHKKTGYTVPIDSRIEDWISGIEFIIENFDFLSNNSRSFFMNECSEVNWQSFIKYMISVLEGHQNENP